MAIDEQGFKQAMSHFASGVTIVTTDHEDTLFGMTVAAFCSLSLRPPLVLVCIDKRVRTHDGELVVICPEPETRQAIAIVYTDHSNRRIATVPAREVTDGHPYLQVEYTDNSTGTYNIIDDATLYTPRFSTPNLIVSDGYARRVFLKVATDSLAKDSAVHTARLRLHVVPESLIGTALTDDTPPVRVDGIRLILYIPDSPDPANPAFKTGQRIIEVLLRAEQDTVQFSMTNAIFLVLQGSLKNNGFAIRVRDENTELRQVEFYGTGAPDSLRPTCSVTTSTPADFH